MFSQSSYVSHCFIYFFSFSFTISCEEYLAGCGSYMRHFGILCVGIHNFHPMNVSCQTKNQDCLLLQSHSLLSAPCSMTERFTLIDLIDDDFTSQFMIVSAVWNSYKDGSILDESKSQAWLNLYTHKDKQQLEEAACTCVSQLFCLPYIRSSDSECLRAAGH